jgi:Protein of unknown function (DUF2891)
MSTLTPTLAQQFMTLTLGHLGRQYPYKMDLVLGGSEDARPPIEHHPIFHGSFDWHSCVHGWWQVMRLARLFPASPVAAEVRSRADAMLVPDKVAGELAYFARPYGGTASRPYGWAWLLALHQELAQHDAPWAATIEPLARDLAGRFAGYLGKLTYPIRVGTHFNTSFAATLAHDWATIFDPDLKALIETRARHWFGNDRGCQAWEPDGDAFLSPALCEALVMSRVLDRSAFAAWFAAFLPDAAHGSPETLFTPAHVSDRSDGKIAHLDGLNLSRAWCWHGIAKALAPHALEPLAAATATQHIEAALPHIGSDYMGEHWLATYAVLALEG